MSGEKKNKQTVVVLREKQKLRGNMITALKCMKIFCKEERNCEAEEQIAWEVSSDLH